MTADFASFRYHHDGLALHGRIYGRLHGGAPPFVCLAGLTRNARDFHAFALAMRDRDPSRPIVAFDYRGRGRSDRVADPSAYSLLNEKADLLAGLAFLGLDRAIFVGTSRGALLIQLLALDRLDLIAAAVLNDAGPKLEMDGLLAIKAYVGRIGVLSDWNAATDMVEAINRPTFPALERADFERMARANFIEADDGIMPDYDQGLSAALAGVGAATPLPELWDAFRALRPVPVLVLRGEHSGLLSRETVTRMQREHQACEAMEIAGQGHAPLLETPGIPERIARLAEGVAA